MKNGMVAWEEERRIFRMQRGVELEEEVFLYYTEIKRRCIGKDNKWRKTG